MRNRHPVPIRAYRLVLVLLGTCVGLLAVVVHLALRGSGQASTAALLRDPEVRREAISRLVNDSSGIYDSHPDADVGRVLLPGLRDREDRGIPISTNRFGMREREYAMPKPEGLVRIVLLGDSMVYGLRIAAEERMGVHLESWLRERTGAKIECLHIAVSSWNIRAEAAYLRRRLSDLDPDLVVHVIVANDLADSSDIRGFGAMARFSSQRRARADVLIDADFPRRILGFPRTGYLPLGLDYESRERYRAAAAELERLAAVVEQTGAGYRLLVHFRRFNPIARKQLGDPLGSERAVYLSTRFGRDPRSKVARGDPHWSAEGQKTVARLIYGLITRDDLLPDLDPPPWDEASQTLEEIGTAGAREAARELDDNRVLALNRSPEVASELDFTALTAETAAQIHGGLDAEGRVSPYASVMLRNAGGHLRLEGRAFPRQEIDGARVRVFIDRDQVGTFEIRAGAKLALRYPLPAAAAGRPFLSVRFEADDYIHHGDDLRHCVAFILNQLAIEA